MVYSPPAKSGDVGSIPGSGRFPEGGSGNPLQYSCLENPMDRGAWRATIHKVAVSNRTEHARTHTHSRRIPETDLEFMRSNRERSDKGGPSHNMEMVVPFHWRRDLRC